MTGKAQAANRCHLSQAKQARRGPGVISRNRSTTRLRTKSVGPTTSARSIFRTKISTRPEHIFELASKINRAGVARSVPQARLCLSQQGRQRRRCQDVREVPDGSSRRANGRPWSRGHPRPRDQKVEPDGRTRDVRQRSRRTERPVLRELLVLTACLGLFLIYLAFERVRLDRALRRVPRRIAVTGTRGKSSVTRLIAAGLRASGARSWPKRQARSRS